MIFKTFDWLPKILTGFVATNQTKPNMQKYKRLDENRPYTLNELFEQVKFFKKSEFKKLLEKVLAADATLTEKAMYLNNETDFYAKSIISKICEISPEFKKAKADHERTEKENSPLAKLIKLLNIK